MKSQIENTEKFYVAREKVAERFGELCDRVKLVIDNEFSRMEVESKRKMA